MLQTTFEGAGALSVPDLDMLVGLTDLTIWNGPFGPVLYATSRAGGYLTSFDLGLGSGTVSLAASWEITVNFLQLESTNLAVLETDQGANLLLIGLADNDLQATVVTGSGFGSRLDYDAGAFDLRTVSSLEMAVGGTTGIAALRDGSVVQLSFDAQNQTVSHHSPSGIGDGVGAAALATIQDGDTSYAVVGYGATDSLGLLRMDGAGQYVLVDSIQPSDGLWVDRPGALTSLTGSDGVPYVVLAASGSSSLTILAIEDDQLVVRDHLLDTLGTRFAQASFVQSVDINGQNFVIAAGSDHGISVMTLLEGGRLQHVATIAASVETPISGISALDVHVDGNSVRIFVATQSAPYLVEFEFTLDNPGENLRGGSGDDVLTGGTGDDIISGGAGSDSLEGGAGNDIISDGQGSDTLRGQAGDDTFVLGIDGVVDQIADYQRGVDRIVIESPNLISYIGDVQIVSRSWGAELHIGTEELHVYSDNGASLTALDFEGEWISLSPNTPVAPERFSENLPDYGPEGGSSLEATHIPIGAPDMPANRAVPVIAFDMAQQVYSSTDPNIPDDANQIFGLGGNDLILGADDGDVLLGAGGFDTISGLSGNDSIDGGAHADRLTGGSGHDVIVGGDGFDVIFGDSGNDSIWAGAAPDRIFGGEGNDWINAGSNFGTSVDGVEGGAGNDTILGSAGYDLLRGGAGEDVLDGGHQADNLYGEAGNDILLGNLGFDRLFGGDGDDQLYGGDGPDSHFGQAGHDSMWGGEGNDRFFGQSGNDYLNGGDGDDILGGNAGFDTLEGGAGDDVLYGDFNADRFVFANGHGHDRIIGFDALGHLEVLDFSQLTEFSYTSEIMDVTRQSGADVIITTGQDSSIRLVGVLIGDLDGNDFLF